MAILKASEIAKKVAAALPKSIEDTINSNLSQGIRTWEMDETWEFYEDDIVDNAEESDLQCKFIKKVAPHDPEVQVKFIKFTPKQ